MHQATSLATATRRTLLTLGSLALLGAVVPGRAQAQDDRDRRADVDDRGPRVRRGIIFGDAARVDGIRINYRDANLVRVRGMNVTLWTPHDDAFEGEISGVALGLPSTGGGDVTGLVLAPLGAGFGGDISGLTVTGIGAAAGGDLGGLTFAGIGVGAGGNARALVIGGLGAGVGGSLVGGAIGGLGVGAGGDARGLLVGGLGVGAGGDVGGFLVGGLGVGAGGDVRGVSLGGLGTGAGGDVTGLSVAGLGIGAGGMVHGLAVAGLGIGSPELRGLMIAPLVGTEEARAIIIAPALFRTEHGADITGATISAVNAVRGDMAGLSIGIVNYAESMRGVQLGLINIIRDNPAGRRVLPILNWD